MRILFQSESMRLRDKNYRMNGVHAQIECNFSSASRLWRDYVIAKQMSFAMRINIRSALLTKMCDCFDN